MSVEKYEKDEQIKKVRPMNTGREGEIWRDMCQRGLTVKETIGVDVNEKAALSSDKNCPFVYINFDFTLVNKVASL